MTLRNKIKWKRNKIKKKYKGRSKYFKENKTRNSFCRERKYIVKKCGSLRLVDWFRETREMSEEKWISRGNLKNN